MPEPTSHGWAGQRAHVTSEASQRFRARVAFTGAAPPEVRLAHQSPIADRMPAL